MKKALIFVLGGLLLFSSSSHADSQNRIAFCLPNNMVSALFYVADAQGYLREEGLDASFVTATNAKICLDDLNAGKADVMAGAEGPFNYYGFADSKLKIVAQIEENPETALFARRDRGIEKSADIKGKTIAYLPGSSSYLYLAHLLNKLNLSWSDIHLINLQPPAMPQALLGGLADAFVMWEPWGDQALKTLGDKAVRLHEADTYDYIGNVIVTPEMTDRRAAQTKAVLRAMLKAEAYIHAHPDAALTFLAQKIKFDRAVLEKNWPAYRFRVELNAKLIQLLDDNARFIQRDDPNFKDKALPDYARYIDARFLRAVAPERIEKGM